ncbi:unnamed protein product [Prunus armeniaca]|uniref:Uncharacterized protein n=1 Tax=Prunus armeniaca TaxID=36596 RepID=A0A6J5VP87_PRUAR|nr:unnamed protein product [Prunus armeniaca]
MFADTNHAYFAARSCYFPCAGSNNGSFEYSFRSREAKQLKLGHVSTIIPGQRTHYCDSVNGGIMNKHFQGILEAVSESDQRGVCAC